MAVPLDPFSPTFLQHVDFYTDQLAASGAQKICFFCAMQETLRSETIQSLPSRITGIDPLIIRTDFSLETASPKNYSFKQELSQIVNFATFVNGFSMVCTISGSTLKGRAIFLTN